MACAFEVPSALVEALTLWETSREHPKEMEEEEAGRKAYTWHDRQRCIDSQEAYEASYQSYTELRNLQQAIRVLGQVVDNTVKEIRNSVMASHWRKGLDSLPSEIIIEIIETAGSQYVHAPVTLHGLLRTLIKVPGFGEHVKEATSLTRVLLDPSTIQGSIPLSNIRNLESITKFYFTTNSSPFHVLAPSLRQMTSLRYLQVSADFQFATLYTHNVDWVGYGQITLPCLEELDVLDSMQSDNPFQYNRLEPDWSPNNNARTNLSWFLGTLDAPKLRHVSVNLTLHAGRGPSSNAATYALGSMAMDTVETFELKGVALQDRQKANGIIIRRLLQNLPQLQSVVVSSCDFVRYVFEPFSAFRNENFRSLRLEYPDGKALHAVATKPSELIRLMMESCPNMKEVIVVSRDPGILLDAQNVFRNAYGMTDRSILDE